MNKIFLIILLTAVSCSSMAEDAYHVYGCPTEKDANSCSKSCTKSDTKWDFKVNISNGVVLQNATNKGVTRTFSLENCKIANVDNWVCGSGVSIRRDNKVDIDEQRMANGVFVSLFTIHNPNGWPTSHNSCAKKISLFGLFD
ncbi:MAG TPA: hypothetical protein VMV48_13775 [Gallionellaceae bacterium]|nr:hypothetical protein [Gallionellaceae bacterium]